VESKLGPLGTSATEWPIVPALRDCDGEFSGMKIVRGNRSIRRKLAPVPLCPPQIPLVKPVLEPGPPRWEVSDQPLELWRGLPEPLTSMTDAHFRCSFSIVSSLLSRIRWSNCYDSLICASQQNSSVHIFLIFPPIVSGSTTWFISQYHQLIKSQFDRIREDLYCLYPPYLFSYVNTLIFSDKPRFPLLFYFPSIMKYGAWKVHFCLSILNFCPSRGHNYDPTWENLCIICCTDTIYEYWVFKFYVCDTFLSSTEILFCNKVVPRQPRG
jgi:hypothetical protein